MDREKVVKDNAIRGLQSAIEISGALVHLRKEHAKAILALLKENESEAKWIYGEDETGVDGWYCSECNFFEPWFYEFTDDIDFIRFYRHCPSCGREMTSYTGKPTKSGG